MSVQVSCRLRHEARADEQGATVVSVDDESHPGVVRVRVDGNKASETTEELSFALDRVFPPSITQLQVYDAVARPCVRDLIDGYHCSILAYGQTGSGKTFTTIGGETDESQGLIPRLLHGLFAEIASSQSSEVETTLSASFLEIYQERLRDLLSLSALGNVIYALTSSSPSAYVPYRDSKLTRLLQTSLGGNAKTHLLLCCSDNATHVSETLSTLRFGLRARAMQNRPERVRTLLSTQSNEDESLERLRILEQKLASLYDYILQLESAACPNCSIAAKEGLSAMRPATSQEEGEREEPPEERLRDELMDAELQTLRGTLAAMQQQLHARDLAQSLDKTLVTSLDSLHSQQERTLRQQEQQLTEADAAIASLHSQLRAGNEEQNRLKVALRRLEAVKRDHDDASQAENEILRRGLEQIKQRDAQTLKELVLSRRREQGKQFKAAVVKQRPENPT
ncbi:hypothetical protein Poli38472_003645 [Pythium oligandrum]|uniref:Kinesin motor domain-containing protein n=1 Tax=Pythium oligandrum TaxID=41045 RepID=A0A8K1FJA9_PYTOL|nr:hypothetical protein Poli38472_003645 [Pythium oligandrum]|eukprot:TMW65880.1 hypothetical protein Poli38472_003645 [Pythium oligandrum]